MKDKEKLEKICAIIFEYGGIDGGHHKQWLLNEIVKIAAPDYDKWISDYEERDINGEPTYLWDEGINP